MPGEAALLGAVANAAPGIGTALSAAQLVAGFINKGKAKRAARELERSRPEYEISPLAQQDLDLAESELASGGLSSDAENAYNNLNNQQFSASLGAILRGGGAANNVGDLFGANEEGRLRLALLNDQMRVGQIDRLTRARTAMQEEQEKEFEFNDWMPYADKAQATAEARKGAEAQIWGGLTGIANQAMGMAGNKADQNAYNQFLKGQKLTPSTQRALETPATPIQREQPNPSTLYRPQTLPQVQQPNFIGNYWDQIPGADPYAQYEWWQ